MHGRAPRRGDRKLAGGKREAEKSSVGILAPLRGAWSLDILSMYGTGQSEVTSRISYFVLDRVTRMKREYRRRKGIVPSLAKEGWLRPVRKYREASLAGRRRGGSFKVPINRRLNEPPRPLHERWLRAIFLDVASTPPLPRRGLSHSLYRWQMSKLQGLRPRLHSVAAPRLKAL